jgi:transcriptional regulator with XRE-family HTH domain
MTGRNNPPHDRGKRLQTGAELRQWRTRMEISARQLGKLIGVTERSIHRAEKTGKLGTKITLAMELFLSRMAHGEMDLLSSLEAPSRRGRPPKVEPIVVSEDETHYHTHWHGELRTGADIRRWRRSIGIYQKELAKLLGVDVSTLVRAEQSESPSSGLIYGAELLRKKVLLHEFDLAEIKKYRPRRGRPIKD